MRFKFKSIQTKYILLVLACVIASALSVGILSVRSAREMAVRMAAENMNLICESHKYKFDASLQNVQESVEACSTFASNRLESLERFESDEEYRDSYAALLEEALKLVTLEDTHVMSYYVRFSPDLLTYEKGFRFRRTEDGSTFERIPILHIQDYQESDDEHVGWYYLPIEKGETMWLEPYHNANFDREMVSCVSPFYKDGKLVGVIGMDIDFSDMIDDLKELDFFDNGYAFLCSSEGKVYYHPLFKEGTYIQDDVIGFDAALENESSGKVLYEGISNGENVSYAFNTLTNGMRIVSRAPSSEIEADATAIAQRIVSITATVIAVSVLFTVVVCWHITKPLKDITTAAAMIAAGEYDIDLSDIQTQDEVGVLARTLQVAAVELKASTKRMSQLAYKDSLTGVRNKTAYDLEMSALDDEISGGNAAFGIAVLDVNDLKTANDVYGHEQGDKVIRIGSRRICQAFEHCAVFRVGGDEFVVIIRGDELNHIDERLADFAERTRQENAAADRIEDMVNLAVGVAVYDPEKDSSAQEVFNRADARMYKAKIQMKRA